MCWQVPRPPPGSHHSRVFRHWPWLPHSVSDFRSLFLFFLFFYSSCVFAGKVLRYHLIALSVFIIIFLLLLESDSKLCDCLVRWETESCIRLSFEWVADDGADAAADDNEDDDDNNFFVCYRQCLYSLCPGSGRHRHQHHLHYHYFRCRSDTANEVYWMLKILPNLLTTLIV